MYTDGDDYCTCDVGVFSSCPVCIQVKPRLCDDTKLREPKPRSEPHIVDLMLHYQKLSKENK